MAWTNGITKIVELTPTNYGSHKAVKVTVVYTEQYDVDTNKSRINFTVKLEKNSWATSFYATQNKIRVKLTINGIQRIIPIPAYHYSYSWNGKITTPSSLTYNGGTSVTFPADYTITYANSTKANGQTSPPIGGTNLAPVEITHDNDGTKSISITTAIEDDHSSSTTFTTGSASKTETVPLTSIARASTFTLSSSTVTLNNSNVNQTITITSALPNFTHKLYYTFGTQTSRAAIDTTGTITTSKVWTLVPSTMLAKIPSATSGTCTVYCDTYNGSALVGTTTKTFTISVHSNIIPVLDTISAVSEGNSHLQSANFGTLIENYSIPAITMGNATPGTGSTIDAYELIVEYENSWNYTYYYTTAADVVSAVTQIPLSSSGEYKIKIKCWDKRNRESAQVTKTFNVSAYTAPNIIITPEVCGRYDSNGNQDDEGTYFKIGATYTKTNINSKNASTIVINWKQKNASTYPSSNTWTPTTQPSNTATSIYKLSDLLPDTENKEKLDIAKTYDIQIIYTDSVTSVTKTFTIPNAFALLDFNNSGYAIGIGKSSAATGNNTLLEIAMPTVFTNQVATATLESMGLLDFIYPIGSLYLSVGATSPANLFGGTWELTAKGKTLLGADQDTPTPTYAVNTSGGSLTHNHTYSHTHTVPGVSHNHGAGNAWGKWNHHDGYMYFTEKASVTAYKPSGRAAISGQTYNSSNQTDALELAGNVNNATPGASTTNTQNNTTTSNGGSLPPYLAVYIWQRTA